MSGPWPSIRLAIRVYFYDTDAGGVVHNIAYLRMIEAARTELAASLGWTSAEMIHGPLGCPVVTRTEIDYLKPARLGDLLMVESSLARVESVRFIITTDVTREGEEKPLCRARQTLVTVDLATGRPKALREDWRERWIGENEE
jgi:tol-pal system-associated acyl-CoA thioesterase